MLRVARYLVIRWPFTLKKRCRVGTVRLCTVLAMAAVSLLTLPHFLSYTVHRTTFRTMRVAVVLLDNRYLDARAYLHTFNHYLMPIVWYMAPWLVVAVVNILLSMQVRHAEPCLSALCPTALCVLSVYALCVISVCMRSVLLMSVCALCYQCLYVLCVLSVSVRALCYQCLYVICVLLSACALCAVRVCMDLSRVSLSALCYQYLFVSGISADTAVLKAVLKFSQSE